EMLRALELAPADAEGLAIRRVVRQNLAAWSRQAATLRYAFRLPGNEPPREHRPPREEELLQRIFVGPAGDRGTFVTVGRDRMVRQWSFATGAPTARPFVLVKTGVAVSVSPGGEYLTVSGHAVNQLQDLRTGEVVPAPVRPQVRVEQNETYVPLFFLGCG